MDNIRARSQTLKKKRLFFSFKKSIPECVEKSIPKAEEEDEEEEDKETEDKQEEELSIGFSSGSSDRSESKSDVEPKPKPEILAPICAKIYPAI